MQRLRKRRNSATLNSSSSTLRAMHPSTPSVERLRRRSHVSISWWKTPRLLKGSSSKLPMVGSTSTYCKMTTIVTGCSFPEYRVQVNHLATAQLAILLLPLLLQTASKGTTPRLVFVSSGAHHRSPPLKPPTSDQGILDWLNDRSKSEG